MNLKINEHVFLRVQWKHPQKKKRKRKYLGKSMTIWPVETYTT